MGTRKSEPSASRRCERRPGADVLASHPADPGLGLVAILLWILRRRGILRLVARASIGCGRVLLRRAVFR